MLIPSTLVKVQIGMMCGVQCKVTHVWLQEDVEESIMQVVRKEWKITPGPLQRC